MATLSIDERTIARLREGKEPRILFIDLETSPILGWAWEGYETTLLEVEQDTRILCFSYNWQNEKKIYSVALPDFKYKPNRYHIDDWPLVEKLWLLFNEADLIVAQNGDKFDIRVANARFLQHGLQPPAEYKTVDTLKIAKKYFKLTFNSLDNLCRYLKVERKVDAGSKNTWFKCMDGDKAAWKHMTYYCSQDVDRLIKVYDKMKGWHKTHPNLSLLTRSDACPVCQSHRSKKQGFWYSRTQKKQRILCLDCGRERRGAAEPLAKVEVY